MNLARQKLPGTQFCSSRVPAGQLNDPGIPVTMRSIVPLGLNLAAELSRQFLPG
jgi:hypothetical protein